MYKKYLLVAFFLAVVFIGSGVAEKSHAMVIRTGETYSLESYTTLEDDLYVGAGEVSLHGTTTGDVVVVGSNVTLGGITQQDVLVLGGDVRISGDIDGDLRGIVGKIYIDGHITEDVFLGAGTVEIGQHAVIDGDIFMYADNIEYKGKTEGEVKMHGRLVQIKGTVNGTLEVTAQESLSVLNTASIKGDLLYRSPRDAFIPNEGSVEGTIQKSDAQTINFADGFDFLSLVGRILMTVIASVLFVYIFPKYSRRMVDIVVMENPWNVAKGAVVLLVWPTVALFLIFSLLGLVPGVLLFFMYGVTVVTAGIVAPIVASVILARWLKREKDELQLAWVSLGAIVFVLLSLVSILGFVIELLLFLYAYYAVCFMLYDGVWKNRKLEKKEEIHHEEKVDEKEDAREN